MTTDRSRRARVGWTLIVVALALQLAVLSQAQNLGGLLVLLHLGVTLRCAGWLRRAGELAAFGPTWRAFVATVTLQALTGEINGLTYTWGPSRELLWGQMWAMLFLAGLLGVVAIHHAVIAPDDFPRWWPRWRVPFHLIALIAGATLTTGVVLLWGGAVMPRNTQVSIGTWIAPTLIALWLLAAVEVALHAWLPRRAREATP